MQSTEKFKISLIYASLSLLKVHNAVRSNYKYINFGNNSLNIVSLNSKSLKEAVLPEFETHMKHILPIFERHPDVDSDVKRE